MAWLYYLFNLFYDYILAALLAILFGGAVACIAVRARFVGLRIDKVLERILSYVFVLSFSFMVILLFALSRTDPDFSSVQRVKNGLSVIQSWFFPADSLLNTGGMEHALTLDTQWVTEPEVVFYTEGGRFYSVLTNGKDRKLRFSAEEEILQAIFSPDGKRVALKTASKVAVFSLSDDQVSVVYQFPPSGETGDIQAGVRIGAMQWSADSQKMCFFIEKYSKVASQTSWFVYTIGSGQSTAVDLGVYQAAFLYWAKDSARLYFSQVGHKNKEFHFAWFEVPLDTMKPQRSVKLVYPKADIPDSVLLENGIQLYRGEKRLVFESVQPVTIGTHILSPGGKHLWVNRKRQLCYQSAYGVRFTLFGLSKLKDYLMFPAEQQKNDLLIREIRWMPSENYALVRHHTHGLLVLQPMKRKIGILAEGNVGIFGAYPYPHKFRACR